MIAKRCFDFLVSLILLVVLLPLFLVIGVLIKCDSNGPVFFRQKRVGRFGELFSIFKFRTMKADQTTGPQITASGDPRVTRLGAVLRKTKLDELPQLFNVLLGDMSLVGPRPEVPFYVKHYPVDARSIIFSIRPGVTDLASVEFRSENDILAGVSDREGYYINEILPVKLTYYLAYVRDRSFVGDLLIILRTLVAVARYRS